MKIFVTGASGYVGVEVTRLLLSQGHTVVGLARNEERARALRELGVEPVIGDFSTLEVLAKAARSADGVIHLAFGHAGDDYAAACKEDCNVIAAMADAMAGTNKPLVMTSGTGVLGDTGSAPVSEAFPIDISQGTAIRSLCEREAILAAAKGVRTVVFRLPPYVWGNAGSFFIPMQLQAARKLGKAYYILPGDQKASGIHVEDLAHLYVLALEKAPAGSTYHTTSGPGYTAKQIAEAVGKNVGVQTEGITLDEAIKKDVWPSWIAGIFAINNQGSFAKAQQELQWADFKNTDMLGDIASGSYAQKF